MRVRDKDGPLGTYILLLCSNTSCGCVDHRQNCRVMNHVNEKKRKKDMKEIVDDLVKSMISTTSTGKKEIDYPSILVE